MMELISWIATMFSIAGILFNSRKIIWCWPIWLISNILWIIYFAHLKMTPSVVLWIVFSIFNVYGWVQWNKENNLK